jgi:proteasome lid subunit RPN8/RPN11
VALSEYQNEIPPAALVQLRLAAEAAYPAEACGFILTDGTLVEHPNRSTVPDQFVISAADYASHGDTIAAVWHSHAKHPGFSAADVGACKALKLPWALWDCYSSMAYWLDPRQDAGLVGRPWSYGIHDCYGAVRDWYWQQWGLALGDYPRTAEGEWQLDEFDHFERCFSDEGFRRVPMENLQRGDAVLFRIRNLATCNHVAVVDDPEEGLLFQHLHGRLSGHSLFSHWFREHAFMAVRHESKC